jgi:hypothetical protein
LAIGKGQIEKALKHRGKEVAEEGTGRGGGWKKRDQMFCSVILISQNRRAKVF